MSREPRAIPLPKKNLATPHQPSSFPRPPYQKRPLAFVLGACLALLKDRFQRFKVRDQQTEIAAWPCVGEERPQVARSSRRCAAAVASPHSSEGRLQYKYLKLPCAMRSSSCSAIRLAITASSQLAAPRAVAVAAISHFGLPVGPASALPQDLSWGALLLIVGDGCFCALRM